MWCNDSNFNCIWFGLDRNCFFHIIMSFLIGYKTLNSVVCHSIYLFFYTWNSLNKTNHSLVAFRVEFTIVSCFQFNQILFSFFLWVLRNFRFERISKVCKKSQTIFKLNFKWLIINWWPVTRNVFFIASTSIFTKNSFSLKFIKKLDFPDIIVLKWKVLIFADDLKPKLI